MATPTDQEREAFVWMQGRMVQLLLRHDEARFGTTFGKKDADAERQAARWLQPYRDLAVIFYLRDELFDAILPRIKRRLSFDAPRERMVEEPPARGRVDWSRTAAATWRERPGEIPLAVHTRQRRRHFATPPNLLTVCTLLEYRAAAHALLEREATFDAIAAFRHPLNEIINLCTRELAFLQFASLVRPCQEIIAGYGTTTMALEAAVRDDLMPGHNPAYEDLLVWRDHFTALRLLDRTVDVEPQPMLGSDPARDNYLYQLWLFYEWVELFHQRGCVLNHDLARMTVEFWWGENADRQKYRLQHDRGLQHAAGDAKLWSNAPGVRPDFYVERLDRQEVVDKGKLIWREPGFLLDAKYYKPRDSTLAPSGPVKRMIADLQLTGERRGALLFAFQSAAEECPVTISASVTDEADIATTHATLTNQPLYETRPVQHTAQYIQPDLNVQIWRVRPAYTVDERAVPPILTSVLDTVHGALGKRVEVRCRGVFLDDLSVNAHGMTAEETDLLWRTGASVGGHPRDELLLCPKPHVAPWRVDLVSRKRDCCQSAELCHIKHQPGVRKPYRLPRTTEALIKELDHVLSDAQIGALDDDAMAAIIERVEGLTRRFAELTGDIKRLDRYANRVRDLGMGDTLDRLGASERESLALGLFLLDRLDEVGAKDFSAPAIHLSSVMELEIKRRVYQCPNLQSELRSYKSQTLGKLPFAKREPGRFYGDWERITAHVANHWNERCDPDDPEREITFVMFIEKTLERIAQIRNLAAHTDIVSRRQYSELQQLMLQTSRLGMGALKTLVLAWAGDGHEAEGA